MKFVRIKRSLVRNPRILKSLFLLALVGVIGFMTTQALFIDTEQSQDAQFQVGTLDMTVDGPGSNQAETISVTGIGAQNVVAGGKTWEINNVGSLPGAFSFALTNILNLENGCNEPEAEVDTTCDNPGENQGELGSAIAISLSVTEGAETRQVMTTTLDSTSDDTFTEAWDAAAGEIIIQPGDSISLTLNWSTADSSFANEAQSDSTRFDTLFLLEQLAPESTTTP